MTPGAITDDDIINAFDTGSGAKPPEIEVHHRYMPELERELAWQTQVGMNPDGVKLADFEIRAFRFGGLQALTKHLKTGAFRPFDMGYGLSYGVYPTVVDMVQHLATGK